MKVGFIVEGKTEKLIVESVRFREYLLSKNIILCDPVIDANGNGNLLPRHLLPHVESLKEKIPDIQHILVLTDLEQGDHVDEVISRISSDPIHDELIFVSIRAIESWFLADTEALKKTLGSDDEIYVRNPEIDPDFPDMLPWDLIKKVAKDKGLRGPGKLKTIFAKKMISNGFDINLCLQHPNLSSVHFLDGKLSKLAQYQNKL